VHLAAIVAHALFGAAALVTGVVALERGPRFLGVYLGCVIAMLASLGLAFAAEWAELDGPTRWLFAGLSGIGVVVLVRAVEAWRVRPGPGQVPTRRFRSAVGFTVVALTDAFLVVTVLDLGAPTWAVVATGIGVAVAGHFVLEARLAALERGSRSSLSS
jgi:hypothetical protein